MLFIIVSFHHQSEVIFSGTISGKQIFGCKVTFLLRKSRYYFANLKYYFDFSYFFNKPR